jgi:hypothetical protein
MGMLDFKGEYGGVVFVKCTWDARGVEWLLRRMRILICKEKMRITTSVQIPETFNMVQHYAMLSANPNLGRKRTKRNQEQFH